MTLVRHLKCKGYSLLEMMVVITAGSLLLVITGAWMHQSLHFARSMQSQTEHHTNLIRCGWQFRGDGHAARSLSLNGNTLTITGDDATTTYTLLDSKIAVETVRGSITFRDQFALASQSKASWDDSAMPSGIGLIVARADIDGTTSESSPIDLHVQANVQRWRGIQIVSDHVASEEAKKSSPENSSSKAETTTTDGDSSTDSQDKPEEDQK